MPDHPSEDSSGFPSRARPEIPAPTPRRYGHPAAAIIALFPDPFLGNSMMAVDYLGYFADANLVEKTRKLVWDNGKDVGEFFDFLEENELLLVWGPSTEAHPLNAVTDWLRGKCHLPDFGSQLGRELVKTCDYIHFVLDPAQQKLVLEQIEGLVPEDDETFDASIVEYFTDLGSEYAEGYLSDGMDDYYQIFQDLRADMQVHADKTLIVLIPY
jgi:hypothetical protein